MARLGRFSVTTEYFYVTTELVKAKRNYVATEKFYVAIELVRVGRISFAIEDFYVATELTTKESSAAHDRVGRTKAGAHYSAMPRCVVAKEVMHAQ